MSNRYYIQKFALSGFSWYDLLRVTDLFEAYRSFYHYKESEPHEAFRVVERTDIVLETYTPK